MILFIADCVAVLVVFTTHLYGRTAYYFGQFVLPGVVDVNVNAVCRALILIEREAVLDDVYDLNIAVFHGRIISLIKFATVIKQVVCYSGFVKIARCIRRIRNAHFENVHAK